MTDRVYVDAGTSGHGFRLAPVLGGYVARLLLGGAVPELAQFSPGRFTAGAELASGFGAHESSDEGARMTLNRADVVVVGGAMGSGLHPRPARPGRRRGRFLRSRLQVHTPAIGRVLADLALDVPRGGTSADPRFTLGPRAQKGLL